MFGVWCEATKDLVLGQFEILKHKIRTLGKKIQYSNSKIFHVVGGKRLGVCHRENYKLCESLSRGTAGISC